MSAAWLLILWVGKLCLINLWSCNLVHHQALVSAGNLALFCSYKAGLSWQNVIYAVFNGLKRSWFPVDSWGSIVVFVQRGLSKKCPVQLQIVWLEHCPSLSWWCLRWTNLKWEQVKDFQFCIGVFLLCGFDLNSEQTRVVKREWSLCCWGRNLLTWGNGNVFLNEWPSNETWLSTEVMKIPKACVVNRIGFLFDL